MTYAAARARLKKITHTPRGHLPKLTKGPFGSSVNPPGGKCENSFVNETAPPESQTAPPATGPQWPPECLSAERRVDPMVRKR